MLKLYHAEPAANSLKALIALKEENLPFTSHYVNLHRFEQHEPWFLTINPEGQVPVLEHEGAIISQSSVILEYLEDAFPDAPPLRPADALGRAHMRRWTKFVDEHVMGYVSIHGWHRMVGVIARSIDAGEFEKLMERVPLIEQREKWRSARSGFLASDLTNATRKIEAAVDRAEQQLQQTPWIAGDMFTLADINLFANWGFALQRMFPEMGLERRAPQVSSWVERVRARPGVQAALAMPNHVNPALRTFTGEAR
jgi:glutathione S-transferase